MSNLTSTLTLQLKDDGLAAKAKADAEALKKLGASGADLKKLGAAGAELTKKLDGLAASGAKLDAFRSGSRNLKDLSTAMRSARADVAATSAAMLKADTKTAKSAQRAHSAALKREEAATAAFVEQGRAVRDLRKELLASGVGRAGRGLAIGEAMRQVQVQTEAANEQLHRQVRLIGNATQVAAKHQRVVAPSLAAGMGGAGRAQLGDIEARRRVSDGMSRPARARAAEDAAEAEARAQTQANRRLEAREARKQIAGAGLLYAGHKAAERKAEMLHTYREFDDLSRYQGAVADLSEDERKSRIKQALHLGGETRFNDLQVLHAQLDLAQRGVKKDFIEPFVGEVVNYAQAMNTDLGSAAKTLEGILFQTNQNVEDPASAVKTMRRQVDLAVKMSKIGGLNDEDVSQAFKFGGSAGSGAGLSNETMATVFALLRRSGYAGAEAGVAQRAIASKLVSPTSKGLGALDAMGIRWEDYTKLKRGGSADLADNAMQRSFGRKLSAKQKARFAGLFADEDTFGDEGKFITAATDIVSGDFGKVAKGKNKGKLKAQDVNKIAKTFSNLRRMMIESVDAEGLLDAILSHDPTLAQANAWGTDKHGGKILALARKYKEFKEYQEQLRHTRDGFAEDIGRKRNAGYAGAAARLEGSQKNLDSSIGQSLDNGGEGNGGFLTGITEIAASTVQSIAELPKPLIAVGAAAAWLGGKISTLAGGLLVTGTAAGVGSAIGAGKGAAVAAAAGTAAATAAVPAAIAAGGLAASKAALDTVKNKDFADTYLDNEMLGADPAGYAFGAAIVHAPELAARQEALKRRAIPSMLGGGAMRGAMPGIGTAGASFGLGGAQSGSASAVPAGPIFDTAKVDEFTAKLSEAQQKAQQLGTTTATPQIGTGPVDNLLAKIGQAISLLAQMGSAAAAADAGFSGAAGRLQGRSSASFSDGVTPGRGAE
ncbi:phage tail tape measure protein [Methylobacterium sp. E-046]|uniref:phage tail tape measure protein n=1 Tax=Methylobacterium sp. E-046 TaxID=2836576 RepID=UPI001FBB1A45|nr:phage tail tape measure protein [Methylobacterium sp. E-046]MCJ2102705.1 phage tail tape measure protein [Methylobacterium sp. E-046]